jgi:GT2 family glycosyltransferase
MNQPPVGVSIVMTYFERLDQLRTTLESFRHHGYGPEVEVIIADDGSVREPAAQIDTSFYPFPVRMMYFRPEDKWYFNACIPYNRAFAAARGRIVIIQNAECFHYDNIVAHAVSELGGNQYFTYGCYSIGRETFDSIRGLSDFRAVLDSIRIQDRRMTADGDDGWYNHSVHRPLALHFCSAILKEELDALGGFDERYAGGQGYDDDEFLYRIRERGLEVRIVDSPMVVHQWHYSPGSLSGRVWWMFNRNKNLFRWVTRRGVNHHLVLGLWSANCYLRGLFQEKYDRSRR